MGRGTIRFLGLFAVLVPALAPVATPAAEDVSQGAIQVAGTVKIVERKGQEPVIATIESASDVVYYLELDEKGKSLAQVMNREKAEILGIPLERDGKKWLKVLGYPDPRLTAAHELWRRMRCNACVVFPANVNATPPANLHGATPVAGREFFQKEKILAWTRDPAFLWLATDTRILQVGLADARRMRIFGRKDGLPDHWIYQLASDGKTLWIVYKGGVAALDIGSGAIRDIPAMKSEYASVLARPAGTWVVGDSGTFLYAASDKEPAKFPPIPTGERIRKAVIQGIWTPHWARRTAHFLATPAAVGEGLYVQSYGDVYGLESGEWRKVAAQGWGLAAGADRLWFLTPKGVGEYTPANQALKRHELPELGQGRLTHLLIAGGGVWAAADPPEAGEDRTPVGGGLARLDIASGRWTVWKQIRQADSTHVACLAAAEPDVWAVTMTGAYKSKPAHPGMTYVKRNVFEATGFSLNRFDSAQAEWTSLALPLVDVDKRLICGQDGTRAMDTIVPRGVDSLSVGPRNAFAAVRLIPKNYFGGYWPSVARVAARAGDDAALTAAFVHKPEELGLQGEQPLVLNISNGELIRNPEEVGQRVLEAVGHDGVLGLFLDRGRHWAVTEGVVGCYDEAASRWNPVWETGLRYAWRATAAVDDGQFLYVGSDRGLIARLDLASGEFELVAALANRAVTALRLRADGAIVAWGGQEPLGRLPEGIRMPPAVLDADAAAFDGQVWEAIAAPSEAEVRPAWVFRQLEKRNNFDKSNGNFLFAPKAGGGTEPNPRYYVQEVFFPIFLCASADGKRVWASTFHGLVRLDL